MDIIEKQLLPAVKEGNLKSVKSLLEIEAVKPFFNHSKASKSYRETRNHQGQYFTEDGFLLIHVAAAYGHTELVKLFLNYFEVDVVNRECETPLMVAASYNQEETVKFLLDAGASVNYQSDPFNERSTLLTACTKGHGKIVKLLLDHGAKLFSKVESVKSAMASGQKDIIEMLLKQSNYKQIFFKEALLVALDLKDVEITRMIMENGKKSKSIIKFLSNNGFLAAAASTSTVSIVQLLLDVGVDVNPSQGDNWSALHQAAYWGNLEFAKVLLENGAHVNNFAKKSRRDEAGTPLFYAIKGNRSDVVEILLEYGADVHLVDAKKINFASSFDQKGRLNINLILCKHIVKLQSEKLFVNEGYLTAIDNNEMYR